MTTAQEIIAGLVARGIPEVVAIGAASRMNAESGLDPSVNERHPLVAGSRGGFGLNQWTGPRRVQFEKFAAERGAAPSDLGTQLDFTAWELHNTERGAYNAMLGAKTPEEAARLYMTKYLRPGIPHADMRDLPPGGLPTDPQARGPAQNALAGNGQPMNVMGQALQPPQWQIPQLDPAAFMRSRNALSPVPLQDTRKNPLGRL